MIFIGSRASTIGSFDISNSDCQHCDVGDTQKVSVFGKYLHIFWIPIFPIGKKAVAECTHCKRTIDQKEFSPDLKKQYIENKGKVKRPFWHWIGLGLLGLFVALIASVIITAEVDPEQNFLTQMKN